MNNDLISRSWLLRDPYFREDRYPVSHHLRMAIMEQPAVDLEKVFKSLPYVKEALETAKQTVAPVRHGRWISCSDKHAFSEECSVCGEGVLWGDGRLHQCNYCPHCGAKMDGGADDATD